MFNSRSYSIVFLAIILSTMSLVFTGAQEETDGIGEFTPEDCPFEIPADFEDSADIVCGTVTVPQFHAEQGQGTFTIGVSVLKSSSDNPAADPLLMNSGGPGGSTILELGDLLTSPVGTYILQQRDIVLMEVRGTVYTEPYLFCEPLFEALTDDDMQAAAQGCQTEWEAQGVRLDAFNSIEIVSDMVMTIDALDYEIFNYYGVSYGTVFGQHLLRDYPDRVRAVVFDAVTSLEINYIPRIANNADRVFGLLFEYCTRDAYCSENYPDLESMLINAVNNLNAEPRVFTVEDAVTGELYEVSVDGDHFIQMLFDLMYFRDIIQITPDIIGLVSENPALGDIVLQQLVVEMDSLDRNMSLPLGLLVTCAEDGDIEPDEYLTDDLRPFVLSGMESYLPAEACSLFNTPMLGDYVDEPVSSDIPALVLSGEMDPITPPEWGDLVSGYLSNAYTYTFPTLGHGTIWQDACPVTMMLAFLNNPDEEPDSACIADLHLTFTSIFDE